MSKTITFNELRRIKDSLPDGSTHRIADGGLVILDDTTIYDMAIKILEEQKEK